MAFISNIHTFLLAISAGLLSLDGLIGALQSQPNLQDAPSDICSCSCWKQAPLFTFLILSRQYLEATTKGSRDRVIDKREQQAAQMTL